MKSTRYILVRGTGPDQRALVPRPIPTEPITLEQLATDVECEYLGASERWRWPEDDDEAGCAPKPKLWKTPEAARRMCYRHQRQTVFTVAVVRVIDAPK